MAAAALPRLFGVVGAGQMGAGIAQVAATHGLQVPRRPPPPCKGRASAHCSVLSCAPSVSQPHTPAAAPPPPQVVLVDRAAEALGRALGGMERSLARLAAKGALPPGGADPAAVLGRVATATSLDALAGADYVVEAVPESEELKRAIFAQLDALAPPHAVLASNTSSISITRLGAATARPEQVVGLHFMNPVRRGGGRRGAAACGLLACSSA